MAWSLIRGGAGAVKAYVLGDPEEERALYHVLELALLDAIEESTSEADAATIEKMKEVLERWFSYPGGRWRPCSAGRRLAPVGYGRWLRGTGS